MNTYSQINPCVIDHLRSITHDISGLFKYLDIVEYYLINPPKTNYEKHHILPKSEFPEYRNLTTSQWNKVYLPYTVHLECHKILSDITNSLKLKKAFWYMSNISRYNPDGDFDSSYHEAKESVIKSKIGKMVAKDEFGKTHLIDTSDPRFIDGSLTPNARGKITVKNTAGETFQVDRTDPRFIDGELVGVTHGTVTVKDCYDNIFRVDKLDPRYISGELVSIAKDTVVVIDQDGTPQCVSVHDPRYISRELVGVNKNKVVAVDQNGNKIRVDKNDPRLKTKELNGIAKNKVNVKDSEGNFFQVSKNDPRYISGELVGVMKGTSWYNNGVVSKKFLPDQVPDGFIKGRKIL